jgi:hypothetical protein
MKRSTYMLVAAGLILVLASLFAPAPFSRTVQADKNNACPGLRNAYEACSAHNPNPSQCDHILEQLNAHGCRSSSHSSGSN